jgi:malate dehydrogenase (oxaloacetate-decarboxylating)
MGPLPVESIKKIFKTILCVSVNAMKAQIMKEVCKDMDIYEESLRKHFEWNGKLEINCKSKIDNMNDLALAYTPGVAEACRQISKDESLAYKLTGKANLVAVITDGTAVLGLGNIGPSASMPVMEGKCVLFRELAGVNAIPICINSEDVDEIVSAIYLISKSFGGINLEDISAPRCFEIERRLKEMCDIPVFHDDQHGTAIVCAAALRNSLKIVNKNKSEVRTVISGAGAAGVAIAKLLLGIGFGDIILCDLNGIIYEGESNLNLAKQEISKMTNRGKLKGSLKDALKGADIFIGVSGPNIVTSEMIGSMNSDAIVFAMANPVPEIMPELAIKGGARIVGTGRSDYPNQINNVLAFPGIFKGALTSGAKAITHEMKLAAVNAIADMIDESELSDKNILPNPLDKRVADRIAKAISELVVGNK